MLPTLEKWPKLRVIYMTGYTRNAIVHNGMPDPGTRLLTKPFTLEELDRELRELLMIPQDNDTVR
jgi:CheY-like chemotaxis protein